MTYQPTQADLDARERARQAGRAAAAAAQVHTPTAEDQPEGDDAPVTAHMELLRLDPEPEAGPAITAATAQAGEAIPAGASAAATSAATEATTAVHAPHPMKPLAAGLPTAVWLSRLALFHGADRVGPRSTEGVKPEGHHRTWWTANGADVSADFTTATAARLFVVDAADEGVTVHLQANAAPAPESAPLAGETGEGGTTAPETAEDAPAAENGAFLRFAASPEGAAAATLAKKMGAYQGGEALPGKPERKPDHFRVTWAHKREGGDLWRFFADFESEAVADNMAQFLQNYGPGGTRGISLEGPLEQDGDVALSIGGLTLDVEALLRTALMAELKRAHRKLNAARWWVIGGWGLAGVALAWAVTATVLLRAVLA